MRDGCPFCEYAGPSEVLACGEFDRRDSEGYRIVGSPWIVIEPLNPVTDGHLLVVPERHMQDIHADPYVLGELMEVAAEVAARQLRGAWIGEQADGYNLIVSAGAAATQTVPHVHVHVIPRREGDGLLLPWSIQRVAVGQYHGCTTAGGCSFGIGGDQRALPRDWEFCPECGGELREITRNS